VNPSYAAVAARAGHRCEYCGAPEVIFNMAFEVEHVIPLIRGGSSEGSNLALACRACNLFKADHLTGDDGAGGQVALFNPRMDGWSGHFKVTEAGEIVGTTECGRATVARLKMNMPIRIEARRLWRSLGLFP
jgi:hypothetical protein